MASHTGLQADEILAPFSRNESGGVAYMTAKGNGRISSVNCRRTPVSVLTI